MQKEIFEIVNDQNEVIGEAPRDEVHRRGLKHRAAHVLVFNSRGELFLQKRSMRKDCFPGTWDSSAAGHLAPGESYGDGAVRELEEELGLKSERPLERLFEIDACAETAHEFVWIYRCHAEGPFVLHPEEIDGGEWFAIDRIHHWLQERPGDFAGSLPLIWRELIRRGYIQVDT